MLVCKLINCPVQTNAFLNAIGVIELFFAFHKIADHIANKNIGIAKGKICVCQVIDGYLFSLMKVITASDSILFNGRSGCEYVFIFSDRSAGLFFKT